MSIKSGSSTYPIGVLFDLTLNVILNDPGDALEIKPPTGDISCNQEAFFALVKPRERLFPLLVLDISMELEQCRDMKLDRVPLSVIFL